MKAPTVAPPRPLRLAAALMGAALLLAACGGSEFQYLKSSDGTALFKMPSSWTVYDENEVFQVQGQGISPQRTEAAKASQWLVAFDAAPRPSLEHVLKDAPTHPTGFAKVRQLSDRERDTYSLASLRNAVFPIDELIKEEGQVELLESEDLVLEGGYRGSRLVFNLRQDDGFLTVNQTALVDPATRSLYLLVVGCEARCYTANQAAIQEVVSSWTVKER